MTDNDWIDNILISYSKSKKLDFKALQAGLHLNYDIVETNFSALYLLTRFEYQNVIEKMVGFTGWAVNYNTNRQTEINGSDPTLNYEVSYLNTQAGLGIRTQIFNRVTIDLSTAVGYIRMKDLDDHLLRFKTAEAIADGLSIYGAMQIKFTPSWFNDLMTFSLNGEIDYLNASGGQNQTWYADEGNISAGTRIKDIPYTFSNLQYGFGLNLILNLGKTLTKVSAEKRLHEIFNPLKHSGLIYRILNNKLVLSWAKLPNSSYNIYGRIRGSSAWHKLNDNPLQDNYVVYDKPPQNMVYQFRIFTVINGKESIYSGIMNVKIDE